MASPRQHHRAHYMPVLMAAPAQEELDHQHAAQRKQDWVQGNPERVYLVGVDIKRCGACRVGSVHDPLESPEARCLPVLVVILTRAGQHEAARKGPLGTRLRLPVGKSGAHWCTHTLQEAEGALHQHAMHLSLHCNRHTQRSAGQPVNLSPHQQPVHEACREQPLTPWRGTGCWCTPPDLQPLVLKTYKP